MTKPGLLHILLLAGSILSSGAVWAADLKETVPGTKYSKVSPKPYGELEQNPNITNFMTPMPVQKQTKEIYFSANEMETTEIWIRLRLSAMLTLSAKD